MKNDTIKSTVSTGQITLDIKESLRTDTTEQTQNNNYTMGTI